MKFTLKDKLVKPKLCKAGQQLREQFDDTFPDRDRRSDGWIADARHVAAGTSDHIPDSKTGTVRAIDVDRDVHKSGKPDLMPDIADQIRLAAKSGEKRISYVIFNGRIASSRLGWRWRKYTGSNPHNHHCHISFTSKGDEDGSFFDIPLLGGTK
jgi:hypothetical protein